MPQILPRGPGVAVYITAIRSNLSLRWTFRPSEPFAMVTINPPGAGLTPDEVDGILIRAKSPMEQREAREVVETLEEVRREHLLPTSPLPN